MNIIATTGRFVHTATKTKSISVLLVSDCIIETLIPLLLLNTLEGPAPLNPGNYICRGIEGEPWQQSPEKLQSTYLPAGVDADGWELWVPKPDNSIELFFSTEDGYVQGANGSTVNGVERLQQVKIGDAICRYPGSDTNQWRVARSIFNATYDITK